VKISKSASYGNIQLRCEISAVPLFSDPSSRCIHFFKPIKAGCLIMTTKLKVGAVAAQTRDRLCHCLF
jgi:hypothetical protein